MFPAPDPRLLFEPTYSQALARAHELAIKGLSAQAFNICRKVAEVNWAMTWQSQDRVFEAHPEVSFWALAGRPMAFRKTWPEGYAERHALLTEALGIPLWTRAEAAALAPPASPDDVLDALIVAWTAHRFAAGEAGRMPPEPPLDRRGLRMEIVY